MVLTINKIVAGVVGLAMVAGLAIAFTATRAHAITLSELVELFIALEVIPADKADEARSVLTNQEDSTPSMTCNFTRNLSVGDTGADVKTLQEFLNNNGYTVAVSGAGSPGNETEYYGPATAGAVAKFQEAYASEILAPLGLTAGTGYFGNSTRAKANTLCAVEDTTPPTPGDDDDDTSTGDDDTTVDNNLSGEASLVTFDMDSADDDSLEEGSKDATIAVATVEFDDGDALITRLDVALDSSTSGVENDPWDTFEDLSIYVDGEKVAEKNIDNEDDYLDEDTGTVRFSGLNILAKEDKEVEITIKATVMNAVDGISGSTEATWNVSIDSMRFKDGDDVTTTKDSGKDIDHDVTFTIEERGGDDEIVIKSSSADPDSSIIKVEDDKKTDWITVFVFDIDTDDSENDIELDKMPVTVVVGTSSYNLLVDDARLVIDGTTIDSNSADVTTSTTTYAGDTAVINFDVDKDVKINAGDKVEAKLELRFKALPAGDEGVTVQGKVTSTNRGNIKAEGADDLGTSQLSGTATGDAHQLMTTGIFAEIVSTDTSLSASGSTDDGVGEFTIKVDVTAFEDTYYISKTPDTAFTYTVLNASDGSTMTSGATTTAMSTTATAEGNSYRVDEGDTETFTFTVTYDPSTAGNYKVRLDTIQYGTTAASPTGKTHNARPVEDFETDSVHINQ